MSKDLELSPERLAQAAARIVEEQNEWRGKDTLNLIASENVMSPAAAQLTLSDFAYRYAEGEVGRRYYEGTKYVDELESLCEKAFNSLFGSDYSNVKPLSGAQANLAIFMSFATPGDEVASFDVPSGGHISYREFGAAGCRGLKVNDIPFDPVEFRLDYDRFTQLVREKRGKLKIVTLGGSLILFPHPVREVSKVLAEESGTSEVILHYDAAHVLGLIAGGLFQKPFEEGAQVMSSSTHKTFPGPQGGVVLAKGLEPPKIAAIRRSIFPGLVSNHHLHRLPSLLYTLAEMMRFGSAYASQTVSNAKKLAKALSDNGFKVAGEAKGYTESHQVAFDASDVGGGTAASTLLASANIITNKNLLPGEPLSNSRNPSGIRLGVQEMTRLGMGEKEMYTIAELFDQLLHKKADPSYIAQRVRSMRKEFRTVKYTFGSP
ncbi:MAG: serine hydroxymethyltransferase [Thermoprotei archaeon]